VYASETSKLWYKPDTRFSTPKGQVYLALMNRESYEDPKAAVSTNLLTKMLVDSMNEVTYYAEVAGLAYAIQSTTVGLQLIFSGYSDKLLTLAEEVVGRLIAFAPDRDRFEVIKEQLQKTFENHKFEQPYQQAIYATSILSLKQKWHIEEYLEVLKDLAFEDFQTFLEKLMRGSAWTNKIFILGNLTEAQSVAFVEKLEGQLGHTGAGAGGAGEGGIGSGSGSDGRGGCDARTVMQLEGGKIYRYSKVVGNEAEDNGAINISFQVGRDDFKRNVLMQLWVQMAERPVFHTLRSVEQIGYIVAAMDYDMHGVKHIYFILQSTTKHPESIDASVETFLVTFAKTLEEMSQADFDDHVKSLIGVKTEKLKSLAQEGKRQWAEIDEGSLEFERQEREVQELKKVSKQDLLNFDRATMGAASATRRKLSVQLVSQKMAAPPAKEGGEDPQSIASLVQIEDRRAFKKELATW